MLTLNIKLLNDRNLTLVCLILVTQVLQFLGVVHYLLKIFHIGNEGQDPGLY